VTAATLAPLTRVRVAQLAGGDLMVREVPAGATAREAFLAAPVEGAAIDTRTLRPGMLFVPLPGRHADGHEFLEEAFRRGAAVALCERGRYEAWRGREPGPLVVVEDVTAAAVVPYHEVVRPVKGDGRMPLLVRRLRDGESGRVEHYARGRHPRTADVGIAAAALVLPHDEVVRTIKGDSSVELGTRRGHERVVGVEQELGAREQLVLDRRFATTSGLGLRWESVVLPVGANA